MPKAHSNTRLLSKVKPNDLLYCWRGEHWLEASEFPIRRRSQYAFESAGGDSYRSYCKECHRTRNGKVSGPLLNFVKHVTRDSRSDLTDSEIAARKILREARADSEGKPGWVYLITEEVEKPEAVKLGYSVSPSARCGELQTGNHRRLMLLATQPGTKLDERALHKRFIKENIVGEWFRPTRELLLEFGIEKGTG